MKEEVDFNIVNAALEGEMDAHLTRSYLSMQFCISEDIYYYAQNIDILFDYV